MNDTYLARMDTSILSLVTRARRLAWGYPGYILPFSRLVRRQKKAASLRAKSLAEGISVPAFMIVSVTRRCNLRCKGCYSHVSAALEAGSGRLGEMDDANLARVVDEGARLGVSFVLLAGGEPFVRAEAIYGMARRNPDVIFPVFTNGTLIDEASVRAFRRYRNLIPVLSVEGGKPSTDARRGMGAYETALKGMRRLRAAGVFFGVSFTVMKNNVAELTSLAFIDDLSREGVGVFFYNEYTPLERGTDALCIDEAERGRMLRDLESRRAQYKAIFLAFPGDEDRFGGCLSAGRGFVHVAPDGRLEACPFAPFGDTSARDGSLRDALASPLLAAIRAHHGELSETAGGCALWDRGEWAYGLLSDGAAREAGSQGDAREMAECEAVR